MKFESFIARRYLSSRRKPLFASFLLFISLLGVTAGVFSLIFVLSVMNGFENDFRQRVLNFKAPVVVLSRTGEDLSSSDERSQLAKIAPHARLVPFAEGEAVIQSEEGGALGVRVRGISETPSEARLGNLYESTPFGPGSLLLGEEVVDSLKVHPDFQETVRLVFPIGDVGPTGELTPRLKNFKLTGMFHSGFYDYDSKYALVPYRDALALFGDEARTGIEVWVPYDDAEALKKKIEKEIGTENVTVQTWRDQNPKLFAALKLEKFGMFLLLSALLLVSSFNIFGLTSLTVMEKIRDMAVLRSSGLSAKGVRRIFLIKAAGIGLLGSFAGGTAGVAVVWFLKHEPVRLPTSYYVEFLPVLLDPSQVIFVLLLVPVLALLSALYPAIQASRPTPVETLRYE
jgi:lipoprotein-releasing system permease protein